MTGTATERVAIEMQVNGRTRAVAVAPHECLLDVLREELGLTGTKPCCLVGECGACTVSMDGRIVDSCLVLAMEAAGSQILTIEGVAREGRPTELQEAFLEHGAVQCGYCTPGQVMAAQALLECVPHPTEAEIREAMAGNLCRCGCYPQITDAVLAASGSAQW